MLRKFFNNLGTLTLGTIVSQLFLLLTLPILSRVFTKEEFGLYGSFFVFINLLSLISVFTYDLAIVKENDQLKSHYIFQTCLILNSIFCFFLFVIIFIINAYNPFIFDDFPYIFYMPLLVFFTSIFNIFFSLFNRKKDYKFLSKVQISRSIFLISFQILLGYSISTFYGLVWGLLASLIIVSILFFYRFFQDIWPMKVINRKEFIFQLNTNKDFLFFTTPQGILNFTSQSLPILIFPLYFDMAIVGAYFLAQRIVMLPSNFIGGAIKRVFYRQASELKDNIDSLMKVYFSMNIFLFLIIVPFALIIFMYAEQILPLILGEEWDQVGIFCKWLAVMFGANFILAPTRSLYLIFDLQSHQFFHDLIVFSIRLVLLLFLFNSYSAEFSIMVYSSISAFLIIIMFISWCFYLTYKKILNP